MGNDDSLIKSDILMGLGEAYAQCSDEQNALHYLGLTHNHFPSDPELDLSYTLTFYLSKKHKVKRYIIDAISVVLITITLFSTIFAITAYATHPQIIFNKQTGISLPGRPAPAYSSSSQNDNATPTPISTNYSALQPGPGCDKGGGTWTAQGIDNIACGTTLTINPPNSRGHLYLQLPNNKAFLPNNTIGIATALAGYGSLPGSKVEREKLAKPSRQRSTNSLWTCTWNFPR